MPKVAAVKPDKHTNLFLSPDEDVELSVVMSYIVRSTPKIARSSASKFLPTAPVSVDCLHSDGPVTPGVTAGPEIQK